MNPFNKYSNATPAFSHIPNALGSVPVTLQTFIVGLHFQTTTGGVYTEDVDSIILNACRKGDFAQNFIQEFNSFFKNQQNISEDLKSAMSLRTLAILMDHVEKEVIQDIWNRLVHEIEWTKIQNSTVLNTALTILKTNIELLPLVLSLLEVGVILQLNTDASLLQKVVLIYNAKDLSTRLKENDLFFLKKLQLVQSLEIIADASVQELIDCQALIEVSFPTKPYHCNQTPFKTRFSELGISLKNVMACGRIFLKSDRSLILNKIGYELLSSGLSYQYDSKAFLAIVAAMPFALAHASNPAKRMRIYLNFFHLTPNPSFFHPKRLLQDFKNFIQQENILASDILDFWVDFLFHSHSSEVKNIAYFLNSLSWTIPNQTRERKENPYANSHTRLSKQLQLKGITDSSGIFIGSIQPNTPVEPKKTLIDDLNKPKKRELTLGAFNERFQKFIEKERLTNPKDVEAFLNLPFIKEKRSISFPLSDLEIISHFAGLMRREYANAFYVVDFVGGGSRFALASWMKQHFKSLVGNDFDLSADLIWKIPTSADTDIHFTIEGIDATELGKINGQILSSISKKILSYLSRNFYDLFKGIYSNDKFKWYFKKWFCTTNLKNYLVVKEKNFAMLSLNGSNEDKPTDYLFFTKLNHGSRFAFESFNIPLATNLRNINTLLQPKDCYPHSGIQKINQKSATTLVPNQAVVDIACNVIRLSENTTIDETFFFTALRYQVESGATYDGSVGELLTYFEKDEFSTYSHAMKLYFQRHCNNKPLVIRGMLLQMIIAFSEKGIHPKIIEHVWKPLINQTAPCNQPQAELLNEFLIVLISEIRSYSLLFALFELGSIMRLKASTDPKHNISTFLIDKENHVEIEWVEKGIHLRKQVKLRESLAILNRADSIELDRVEKVSKLLFPEELSFDVDFDLFYISKEEIDKFANDFKKQPHPLVCKIGYKLKNEKYLKPPKVETPKTSSSSDLSMKLSNSPLQITPSPSQKETISTEIESEKLKQKVITDLSAIVTRTAAVSAKEYPSSAAIVIEEPASKPNEEKHSSILRQDPSPNSEMGTLSSALEKTSLAKMKSTKPQYRVKATATKVADGLNKLESIVSKPMEVALDSQSVKQVGEQDHPGTSSLPFKTDKFGNKNKSRASQKSMSSLPKKPQYKVKANPNPDATTAKVADLFQVAKSDFTDSKVSERKDECIIPLTTANPTEILPQTLDDWEKVLKDITSEKVCWILKELKAENELSASTIKVLPKVAHKIARSLEKYQLGIEIFQFVEWLYKENISPVENKDFIDAVIMGAQHLVKADALTAQKLWNLVKRKDRSPEAQHEAIVLHGNCATQLLSQGRYEEASVSIDIFFGLLKLQNTYIKSELSKDSFPALLGSENDKYFSIEAFFNLYQSEENSIKVLALKDPFFVILKKFREAKFHCSFPLKWVSVLNQKEKADTSQKLRNRLVKICGTFDTNQSFDLWFQFFSEMRIASLTQEAWNLWTSIQKLPTTEVGLNRLAWIGGVLLSDLKKINSSPLSLEILSQFDEILKYPAFDKDEIRSLIRKINILFDIHSLIFGFSIDEIKLNIPFISSLQDMMWKIHNSFEVKYSKLSYSWLFHRRKDEDHEIFNFKFSLTTQTQQFKMAYYRLLQDTLDSQLMVMAEDFADAHKISAPTISQSPSQAIPLPNINIKKNNVESQTELCDKVVEKSSRVSEDVSFRPKTGSESKKVEVISKKDNEIDEKLPATIGEWDIAIRSLTKEKAQRLAKKLHSEKELSDFTLLMVQNKAHFMMGSLAAGLSYGGLECFQFFEWIQNNNILPKEEDLFLDAAINGTQLLIDENLLATKKFLDLIVGRSKNQHIHKIISVYSILIRRLFSKNYYTEANASIETFFAISEKNPNCPILGDIFTWVSIYAEQKKDVLAKELINRSTLFCGKFDTKESIDKWSLLFDKMNQYTLLQQGWETWLSIQNLPSNEPGFTVWISAGQELLRSLSQNHAPYNFQILSNFEQILQCPAFKSTSTTTLMDRIELLFGIHRLIFGFASEDIKTHLESILKLHEAMWLAESKFTQSNNSPRGSLITKDEIRINKFHVDLKNMIKQHKDSFFRFLADSNDTELKILASGFALKHKLFRR